MSEERYRRDVAKLEEARRQTQARLEQQQERLNQRLERLQQRLERKLGHPSDTQRRIIEAALGLLQQEGLSNLSQRKLATRLDMRASALYWHFKSKEVLVDYMAEAILEREFTELEPRRDDQTWQDWVVDHMQRLRQAMLGYPDGARVVAGAHLHTAVTLAKSFEMGLVSLMSDGVARDRARQIMLTATAYTFGYVIEEQAAPTPEQAAEIDLEAFLKPFPQLASAISGASGSPEAADEDFLAGLKLIIAGAGQ